MALSTSPIFWATAPGFCVARSRSNTMSFVRSLACGTVIPFDYQSRQPFLCSPHMVSHDGDSVVEPNDLTHPF